VRRACFTSIGAVAASLANAPVGAQTANPAVAETPAPDIAQRYTPADFASFAPRTALDMVEQIPGFSIRTLTGGGDRGLGAARENVLINGQRIADKSTDAQTALSRITAASVQYIEIVDGARLNVPGLTGQVANIVVAEDKTRGFTTTVRWEPDIRPRIADNWLNGAISTTGMLGSTSLTLSLTSNTARQGHWGPERVLGPDGALRFVRDEFGRYNNDRPQLALALARTAANGNILNFNLAGQLVRIRNRITGTSVQPGTGRVDELFTSTEDEWNANVGGDYEFAVGKGRLKLIAQHRAEHSPIIRTFTVATPAVPATGSRFDQTADESESILRGEYGWRTSGGRWRWRAPITCSTSMPSLPCCNPGASFNRSCSAASARASMKSAPKPRSPGAARWRPI
jgi:outer membrane receptor for ferrienterochelin and colicins